MFSSTFVALLSLSSFSVVYTAPTPLQPRAALDFGTCSDPTVKFANGLDGRNEPAFEPNNEQDFNHGSALKIGVISSFICGQLDSKCKASADALTACTNGQNAASTLTGQAAADAFNSALTGGASSSSSSNTATSAVSSAAASETTSVAASTTTSSAAASSSSAASSTTSSGQNLQTFTGTLGGAPPPVTAGGKGFITDNSEFLNKAAAIGRSCDVQHNACANAANSGGGFSVSQCDQQDTACKASASA